MTALINFMHDFMYKVRELAEKMNVSPRTIYRMVKTGKLQCAVKFGGVWRFPKSEIEKLLKRH